MNWHNVFSIRRVGTLFIVVLLSLGGSIPAALAQGYSSRPHTFVIGGAVAQQDQARTLHHLAGQLGAGAGYPLTILHVDSFDELSEVLRNHPDAIGWSEAGPYVEDAQADGQQLVALPLVNGDARTHGVLLTRKDIPGQHLDDFNGRVFGYADPRSYIGYLVPSHTVEGGRFETAHQDDHHPPVSGVSNAHTGWDQQFEYTLRTGTQERAIVALRTGLVDVVVVDELVWKVAVKRRPVLIDELRVVARYGPYPAPPIVAGSKVPAQIVARLGQALEALSQSESGRRLLNELRVDGFAVRSSADYDPVRQVLSLHQRLRQQARSSAPQWISPRMAAGPSGAGAQPTVPAYIR